MLTTPPTDVDHGHTSCNKATQRCLVCVPLPFSPVLCQAKSMCHRETNKTSMEAGLLKLGLLKQLQHSLEFLASKHLADSLQLSLCE